MPRISCPYDTDDLLLSDNFDNSLLSDLDSWPDMTVLNDNWVWGGVFLGYLAIGG